MAVFFNARFVKIIIFNFQKSNLKEHHGLEWYSRFINQPPLGKYFLHAVSDFEKINQALNGTGQTRKTSFSH